MIAEEVTILEVVDVVVELVMIADLVVVLPPIIAVVVLLIIASTLYSCHIGD